MQRVIMVHDDQSYHCGNTDIEEVTQRKMVLFFEILHNHSNKFKVQKENQNIG